MTTSDLRNLSYVLGSTVHGPMIVMRWDSRGASNEILNTGAHEPEEIKQMMPWVAALRQQRQGRIVAIDGGANVGTWTLALAKTLHGWGEVYSFEPQRRLFYALCGNIALNNRHNVHAKNQALSNRIGQIEVAQLEVDSDNAMSTLNLLNQPGGSHPREYVPEVTIDSLGLDVGFIKLDIEGMESRALAGAVKTIERCRPLVFMEVWMSNVSDIQAMLPGYRMEALPDPRNAIFWPE